MMYCLCALHCLLIITSNCLVQYPFLLFGLHTTWGAFTYPLIFVLTDLTTRLLGSQQARQVIFLSLLPALISSYGIASYFDNEAQRLFGLHELPLRIALASACAYAVGQLLDIFVFCHIQRQRAWWIAPLLAGAAGNTLDTFLFFSIAFYHCHNAYLNQYWPLIALTDLGVKMLITCLAIVPLYGIILTSILYNLSTIKEPPHGGHH